MQKRRSRMEMLRSSPFDVRSSMKITLPTNVCAGLQTPTEMPEPDARLFQCDSYWDCRGGLYRPITRKKQYPKCCMALAAAALTLLLRRTSGSVTGPRAGFFAC